LAIAQRSSGSVSNIREIEGGLLEAGLAQADVSHWAYYGQGPFTTETPKLKLRTVATLYLESLHLVVRNGSGITAVSDLVARRVGLDEAGSGTLLEVLPLLSAHNIAIADIKPVYLKLSDAIDRLRRNRLDAFFIVAGYPVAAISKLVSEDHATVISIDGAAIEKMLPEYPFITIDSIPVGTYNNTTEIVTLAVAAQLIVSAELDPDLVYGITRMLWGRKTLEHLAKGHPKGRQLNLETALLGNTVPVHEGARKYYMEVGLIPGEASAPVN
jgi:TRAP transporter TAXI family solute receptor